MDTGPKLKDSQARFLEGMLASTGFTELCRQLGMTKANGALLLGKLHKRGLIVSVPSIPNRRRVVADLDVAGAVVWWDHPQSVVPEDKRLDPRYSGPGRWSVVALPVPRHERADLKTDRWVVAVTAPQSEFAFIASDRERLSYRKVWDEMHRAYHAEFPALEDFAGTVRIVTEMVADAVGVQAVLPTQFIQAEEETSGGEDDHGTDGDAAGGSGD